MQKAPTGAFLALWDIFSYNAKNLPWIFMPLNDHERRLFQEIERGLNPPPSQLREWWNGKRLDWNATPAWIRRLTLGTTVLTAVLVPGLFYGTLLTAQEKNSEKNALRAAVGIALQNSGILAATGTCSSELRDRAAEVDTILNPLNNSHHRQKSEYGAGPTGDELRMGAAIADIAGVPCRPTSDDGAHTMSVNGQRVTLQQNDLLWRNPSID